MDIATSLSHLSRARFMGQVQMAVARKMSQIQQMQGQAALQLLEAAVSSPARAGDALVAAATGLGREIDVLA